MAGEAATSTLTSAGLSGRTAASSRIGTSSRVVPSALATVDLRITLGDALPIDHVPPSLEVFGPPVLVLEVVSVLPDVDPEQWRVAVDQGRVLVRGGRDSEAGAVVDQPCPAAAELLGRGGADLPLQIPYRLEVGLDRVGKRTRWVAASVGGHELPEKRVVRVAAAVVADGGAQLVRQPVELAEQLLKRAGRPLGPLERGVQVCHVAGVVLVVVDSHRQLVDRRFKRAVGIWEWRKRVLHG